MAMLRNVNRGRRGQDTWRTWLKIWLNTVFKGSFRCPSTVFILTPSGQLVKPTSLYLPNHNSRAAGYATQRHSRVVITLLRNRKIPGSRLARYSVHSDRFFIVSYSPSRHTTDQYLKSSHDRFHPHQYQFLIHWPPDQPCDLTGRVVTC